MKHKKTKKSLHNGTLDFTLMPIADLPGREICWRWKNRIPRGMVTVIAGQQKAGKSLVACDIAATISAGSNFPGGGGTAKRGHVVMLNAEDGAADVLKPRLQAAGADLDRIHIAPKRPNFTLDNFEQQLEREIGKVKHLRALILDPITGIIPINRNSAAQVRSVLTALGALAEKHRIAIIAVVHLNKGSDGRAMTRVSGSFEWTAACRAAFLVAVESATGRHLFLPMANNVGGIETGLAFRIKTINGAAAVMWERDSVTTSADEMLAVESRPRSATTKEAIEFLVQTVTRGIPAKEILALGKEEGFSVKELRTAKDALGIKSRRSGGVGGEGRWMWMPPSQSTASKVRSA